MSGNLSRFNWMAGLFGPDLWDAPQDQDLDGAFNAPQSASHAAGVSLPSLLAPVTGTSQVITHIGDRRPAYPPAPSSEQLARVSLSTCPHTGCSPGRVFHGPYELKRHIRVVHTGQKDLACPFPGCFQGPHVSTFARPDKLTSHIKSCHGRQPDILITCPVAGCLVYPSKLADLADHIRNDHLVDTKFCKQRERCGDKVEILRAVANAAPAVSNGH